MSEFRVFCGGPRCATLECVVGAAHDDANRRTAAHLAARPTGLQKKAIEGDLYERDFSFLVFGGEMVGHACFRAEVEHVRRPRAA